MSKNIEYFEEYVHDVVIDDMFTENRNTIARVLSSASGWRGRAVRILVKAQLATIVSTSNTRYDSFYYIEFAPGIKMIWLTHLYGRKSCEFKRKIGDIIKIYRGVKLNKMKLI